MFTTCSYRMSSRIYDMYLTISLNKHVTERLLIFYNQLDNFSEKSHHCLLLNHINTPSDRMVLQADVSFPSQAILGEHKRSQHFYSSHPPVMFVILTGISADDQHWLKKPDYLNVFYIAF